MPDDDYLKEISSEEQRDAFKRLSGQAVNSASSPLVATGATQENRGQAHILVVDAVVGACDILVAAWDGIDIHKPAGTAATVLQAIRVGKPVIQLRPSRSVLGYVEQLVLPILARFRGPAWLLKAFGIQIHDANSALTSLSHLDAFNEDLQRQISNDKRSALHLQDNFETMAQVSNIYLSLSKDLQTDPTALKEFESALRAPSPRVKAGQPARNP